MTIDEANQRLDLSRRVITGWEELEGSGRPTDALRLISEEIDALQVLAVEHSMLAVEAARIVTRYHQFAKLVRRGMH